MTDLISSYLIERIESCGFECEAGPLTMSRDWQYLKDELKQANAVVEAAKRCQRYHDSETAKALDQALAALETEAAILHPQDDRHIGDR